MNQEQLRSRAHYLSKKAVRTGELTRADTCERCEVLGYIEGHHADYAKPLEVEWLCRSCHAKETRRMRAEAAYIKAQKQFRR